MSVICGGIKKDNTIWGSLATNIRGRVPKKWKFFMTFANKKETLKKTKSLILLYLFGLGAQNWPKITNKKKQLCTQSPFAQFFFISMVYFGWYLVNPHFQKDAHCFFWIDLTIHTLSHCARCLGIKESLKKRPSKQCGFCNYLLD